MRRESRAAKAHNTGRLDNIADLLLGELRVIPLLAKTLNRFLLAVILHND